MKTVYANEQTTVRAWLVVDAAGQPMGRIASDVARLLRGKHKTTFTPHADTGDFVIVVNADKVALTGRKSSELLYRHSGWPGGLKTITRGAELARKPADAFRRVVRGMLPHNRLGDQMIRKLKVYAGPDHPHAAQRPVAWTPATVTQGE